MKSAGGKIRTGRMGNHEIPAFVKYIFYGAFIMLSWGLCGQYVTGSCIVPESIEAISYGS
jgi:hypothetical protein